MTSSTSSTSIHSTPVLKVQFNISPLSVCSKLAERKQLRSPPPKGKFKMFIGSLRSSSAKVATITPRDIRKMDDARRVELGCSAVPGFSQHEFTLLPLAEAQTHDEIVRRMFR